jgi:hypothetical protein
VINSAVAVWVAIAASPSVSSEPSLSGAGISRDYFVGEREQRYCRAASYSRTVPIGRTLPSVEMRRLAEDDLVHLLCSYLSAVESSLNRYGTKVARGVLANALLNGPTGVRAAATIMMSVVIWCLPMDVDTAQSLRTLT